MLNEKDVAYCSVLATQAHSDPETIKFILGEWRKRAGEEDDRKGISSPSKLLELLKSLKFFENQVDVSLKQIATNMDEAKLAVFRGLIGETMKSPAYQKQQAKELFRAFDKDHNGRVSFKEFLIGFLVTLGGDPVEQAELQFDVWDADGNGTLSKEEVREMWRASYDSSVALNKISLATTLTINVFQTLATNTLRPEAQKELVRLAKMLFKRLFKLIDEHLDTGAAAVHKHEYEIVQRIFQLADSDANGVLNRAEFVLYSVDPGIKANVRDLVNLFSQSASDSSKFGERVNAAIQDWMKENQSLLGTC